MPQSAPPQHAPNILQYSTTLTKSTLTGIILNFQILVGPINGERYIVSEHVKVPRQNTVGILVLNYYFVHLEIYLRNLVSNPNCVI